MKKLTLALAAALLMAGTSAASAQEPQGQQPRMGGRGNMTPALMQGITLAADQQVKVDSINAKYGEQMRALRQDQSADRETRMAKNRELMGKQREEIKAVLNDEQKKVFDKNVADMDARRQQMGGQRPPTA